MLLQTEYAFTLPRGYRDGGGKLHRRGVMRLAMAIDEIEAMKHDRARTDPDYASVVLLARVIRLEGIGEVTAEITEKLFTEDFVFLQNMYETINGVEDPKVQVQCPECGKIFTDTLNFAVRE